MNPQPPMKHTYAVVIALSNKPFDADAFWFHFERECTGASKNLIRTPHIVVQLVQSTQRASALRAHLDTCPRDGVYDAHILRLHRDRYISSGHAASGWLTRHLGDVPGLFEDD